MTIQRLNRICRLQLEPLEARDVPSVVSPHAGLLRPMARAEVHKAAHHLQAARVHAHTAVAASSAASADAASSSIPPAGSSPEPILTVVLGPVIPFVVTEAQVVQIGPPMTVPAPVPIGSISST